MFSTETVFVVGAGASCELGFPAGVGLKKEIAEYLNVYHTDQGRLVLPDERLREVFLDPRSGASLQQWKSAANRVRAGMAIAPSIDNYLDAHPENALFAKCGKLAITSRILQWERKSPLYADPTRRPELSHEQLQASWLARFAWQLVVDVPKAQAARAFDRLHFIIFNYDRCVEQYLHLAIQAYYDIGEEEAGQILNRVNFYHPYGTVGRLPWQDGTALVAQFGADLEAFDLMAVSSEIRTFTESVDDDDRLSAARQAYANARQTIFLGFSFGKQNMRLLREPRAPEEVVSVRRVYGTAYKISEDDRAAFKSRILSSWHAQSPVAEVQLHDLSCADLFDRYSQSIAG